MNENKIVINVDEQNFTIKKSKAKSFKDKKDMKDDEYVCTMYVDEFKDLMIHIGQDDYGQCYFVEFVENDEVKSYGCGTYNFDYEDTAIFFLEKMIKRKLKETGDIVEEKKYQP